MNLSGRQRLAIVLSAFWVVISYFLIEPYRDDSSHRGLSYIFFGIGPVAAAWAWRWVRAGFAAERRKGPYVNESTRNSIAKRLEVGHQISITSYRYDVTKMLHVFEIIRRKESGHIAFSDEFIKDHTVDGVMRRLKSPEVMRQFDEFGNKYLIISNSGVRVELGG